MADYLSNPFSFWVNGYKKVPFEYDPGPDAKPFHVRSDVKGFVALNILMFARDEQHVKEVMGKAIAFQSLCFQQYCESIERTRDTSGLECVNSSHNKRWLLFADLLREDKLVIEPIRPHHVFKVAWASNDDY